MTIRPACRFSLQSALSHHWTHFIFPFPQSAVSRHCCLDSCIFLRMNCLLFGNSVFTCYYLPRVDLDSSTHFQPITPCTALTDLNDPFKLLTGRTNSLCERVNSVNSVAITSHFVNAQKMTSGCIEVKTRRSWLEFSSLVHLISK